MCRRHAIGQESEVIVDDDLNGGLIGIAAGVPYRFEAVMMRDERLNYTRDYVVLSPRERTERLRTLELTHGCCRN